MGNGWGSALGSAAGNTVSELVVQAPKLLGSSVGSAVGQGVGQALGQGIGGAIGGSSAPAGQGYTATPPAASEPGNAYDGGDYTNVEGVDVVAPSPAMAAANIAPAAQLSMPSFGDVMPYSAPTLVNQLAGSNLPPSNIAGLEVVAPSLPTITQPDSVLSRMAPLTGLSGQPVPTSDEVYGGSQGGGIDEKGLLAMLGLGGGAAGLLKGGLSLLPAGLMAAQLLGGQKDGNKAGQENQQQQQNTLGQIGQLAGQNSGLSKFLSDKAMANLGGNIGGPAMSAIQRAVRASQARIRSRYHQMGMSGSTAEGQDLQAAELQGVETQFKVAQDMATQGLASVAQLTGQSMDAYARILQAQMLQGTALGNASAAFAAASSTALGNLFDKVGKAL